MFQLEEFRRLKTQHGFLTHNARPVQPLGGRNVWYNVGELSLEEGEFGESAAPRSAGPAMLCLIATALVLAAR